jgi:hypothetical protein
VDAAESVALAGDVILLATLAVFALQAREMAKQSAAGALATRSAVYQALTDSMIRIDRMFVERPELRQYIYGGAALPTDELERSRVLATVELIVDFIDNVVTQAPHLPEYLNGPWRVYIATVMRSSVVLQDFWRENRAWYSDEMQRLLDPMCTSVEATTTPSVPTSGVA